jgi:MFS family permease
VLDRVARYFGLLTQPDYRRLWLAHTISQVGNEITLLALPLLAVLVIHASALEVSVLGALQFVAFMLLALPAGAWVDRLPRKLVLVVTDLGRVVVLTLVPIAAALGWLSIWLLYGIAFAVAVLTVFFEIGDQSILPELVDRDRLAEANSRLEVTRSAASVLGPGIGGALVGLLSAPTAILADAASFLASAMFLFGIRGRPAPAPDPAKPRSSIRADIVEGLRFYRRSPVLLRLSAAIVTSNVGIWLAGSTFLVYLVRDLRMTPEAIGLAFSVGAIGLVVGAAVAAGIGARIGVSRALMIGCGASAVSWGAMALADERTAFFWLAASGIVQGLSGMLSAVTFVSLRQSITPIELMGRVNATGRWLNWTLIPAGALAGGVLATAIGIRPTLLIGSTLAFLAVPILALWPIPRVPTPAPVIEGGYSEP